VTTVIPDRPLAEWNASRFPPDGERCKAKMPRGTPPTAQSRMVDESGPPARCEQPSGHEGPHYLGLAYWSDEG
jgi:hypothetical protein